jgi:hypothetical protein
VWSKKFMGIAPHGRGGAGWSDCFELFDSPLFINRFIEEDTTFILFYLALKIK